LYVIPPAPPPPPPPPSCHTHTTNTYTAVFQSLSLRPPSPPPPSLSQIEEAVGRRTIRSTLDPLLEGIAREYTDDADLSHRLQELFEVLLSVITVVYELIA
jgi:hypothetical protein